DVTGGVAEGLDTRQDDAPDEYSPAGRQSPSRTDGDLGVSQSNPNAGRVRRERDSKIGNLDTVGEELGRLDLDGITQRFRINRNAVLSQRHIIEDRNPQQLTAGRCD